jgi:hypothetical protein
MIKLTGDQSSRRKATSHELTQHTVGRKNDDRPRALISAAGAVERVEVEGLAAEVATTAGRRTLTA